MLIAYQDFAVWPSMLQSRASHVDWETNHARTKNAKLFFELPKPPLALHQCLITSLDSNRWHNEKRLSQNVNLTHSSCKAWKAKNRSGRTRPPHGKCSITASSIASQLVHSGTYSTGEKHWHAIWLEKCLLSMEDFNTT